MFEGWDEINPYDYEVNDDLSFTVLHHGEAIYTSRKFRLKVQAERKAIEWIQRETKSAPTGGVTLDVQNMSIDPDMIFGK